MRALLLLLVSCSCLLLLQRNPSAKAPATEMVNASFDTLNFKTQVQPIFEKRCSPCHFPGGKMYDKLPFDQGETIINHQAGILRRIKGENDVRVIKQYLEQSKDDN
jgi:hypothetical protein